MPTWLRGFSDLSDGGRWLRVRYSFRSRSLMLSPIARKPGPPMSQSTSITSRAPMADTGNRETPSSPPLAHSESACESTSATQDSHPIDEPVLSVLPTPIEMLADINDVADWA